MSLSGKEDLSLKSEELVFLLAIAGRIDAQSRLLAQKLDKNRYIYHAYAIVDSLSSSYSMFKYFMEVFMRKTDADYIHKILTSPEGIAAIAAEAIFLVSFSFLASVFEKEEKDSIKKFTAAAWPYFRDVMKGMKNAYKGWRSTVQILSLISGMDLKYMVVPVGLVLGVFAAANRFWIRSMQEQRKKQMDKNKELLVEIEQLSSLTSLDREYYLSQIERQTDEDRVYAYLALGTGGLLDGLYFYVGVVSLAVLSPHLLIAMSIIGAIYTLTCVISRIYEEYDFQLRLKATQTRCKLALTTKELELTYAKLLKLEDIKDKKTGDLLEIQRLKLEVRQLIENFEQERQLLKDQTTHDYLTAALLGIKYGLYAYGVLTQILFTVTAICSIAAISFPPALLAVFIVSGLVFMMGMMAYTLYAHYQHMQKREAEIEKEHPYDKILKMKENIEKQKDAKILTAESFDKSLKDGLKLDPSPPTVIQEWLEVIRSLFSGLSKGNNFSNFVMTPCQDVDSDGDYHDTPVMGALAIASGVLFSLILGLRALARGLGRPPKGQVIDTKKEGAAPGDEMDKIKTQSQWESRERKSKASDSLSRHDSFWNFFSSRHSKPKKSAQDSTLTHSLSDNSLNHYQSTPGSTIGGLD
ncbi:hypothetical protein LEAN103870_04090 [Legionella anisa]|uniref:Transmembrane protein n=1 Tax=Legionella anisa TaxID=28082 RepID=A0AAX0WMR2_9GAMM|nr:hypothetical protein [Legionella anisa]AWN72956.1 hypothetical protein DLD14_03375 [Legionella anisa]KTC70587.1 transmembrane protein [Legionella anisa]MBN5935098.1 hypothetical protein [Legionella anisa]MCW8423770.1 hypothetical protein [Legionella anisa]MCW8447290.1 hypothetical protein [Legionella anisa]